MIQKRPVNQPGFVEVVFSLDDHGYHQPVTLVGDFNEWDPEATALVATGEGRLAVSLTMPVGRRYEFRYRDARGYWFNDEGADDYSDNRWGGMNGVLLT
jgi:1,4-alpha-glucan branching enzyme